MREGTLLTYPHLIDLPTVNGTVFQANHTMRPHLRLVPMAEEKVLKHRKREGYAASNNLLLEQGSLNDLRSPPLQSESSDTTRAEVTEIKIEAKRLAPSRGESQEDDPWFEESQVITGGHS